MKKFNEMEPLQNASLAIGKNKFLRFVEDTFLLLKMPEALITKPVPVLPTTGQCVDP